jgi:uncharacterized protein YwqG
MTYDEALEAIASSPFQHIADRLERLLLPSIRLHARRIEPDELTLGASRLGGQPDLPPNVPWPRRDGVQLAFLAQIRLNDFGRLPEMSEFPFGGWLYFFYDTQEQPWGFSPSDRGHWRVLSYDGPLDELTRTAAEELPPECVFPPCSVRVELEYNLPAEEIVLGTLEIEFDEDESEAYATLRTQVNGPDDAVRHRMFGFADEIQGDMRLECQLVSNGLYCGNSSGYEDPRAAELEPGAMDWLLLLQLDTDEEGPDWMWGDCGRLYFWIREQDLARRALDKVWLILQCY